MQLAFVSEREMLIRFDIDFLFAARASAFLSLTAARRLNSEHWKIKKKTQIKRVQKVYRILQESRPGELTYEELRGLTRKING